MLWGWADIAQAGQMNAVDIQFQDLPPGLAQRFDREYFPGLTRAIADETARRKRDGEFDHLIAYALQSSQFTTEPKIEPAVSVKAFAQSATVPARAFESGRQSSPGIFCATGVCSRPQSGVSGKRISPRVRFLYAKEFLRQKHP